MGGKTSKPKGPQQDPKNKSNLKKPVKKIDRTKIGQPTNFQVNFSYIIFIEFYLKKYWSQSHFVKFKSL